MRRILMASGGVEKSGSQPEMGGNGQAEPYAEWQWLSTRLMVTMFLLIVFVAIGNPLASGKAGRQNARPFVEKLFPDRPVTPSDSITSHVAVVFHLIRSGSPDVA